MCGDQFKFLEHLETHPLRPS